MQTLVLLLVSSFVVGGAVHDHDDNVRPVIMTRVFTWFVLISALVQGFATDRMIFRDDELSYALGGAAPNLS